MNQIQGTGAQRHRCQRFGHHQLAGDDRSRFLGHHVAGSIVLARGRRLDFVPMDDVGAAFHINRYEDVRISR